MSISSFVIEDEEEEWPQAKIKQVERITGLKFHPNRANNIAEQAAAAAGTPCLSSAAAAATAAKRR